MAVKFSKISIGTLTIALTHADHVVVKQSASVRGEARQGRVLEYQPRHVIHHIKWSANDACVTAQVVQFGYRHASVAQG